MKTRKTVSVAMATYNGERYLRQQLDSLLNQSLGFDELVVCDDCSTDSTLEILREYASADTRIKVVENEKNLGFRQNFEKALNLCNGELIALCDQDDIWFPDHLAVLSDNIGNNLLIAGASILADSEGNSRGVRLADVKNFQSVNPSQEGVFHFLMYYQNPFQGASMMLRKEFLKYVLPIPAAVAYHDVWFAHVAALYRRFVFVDTPVTLYRLHGRNTSGQHRKTPRLRTLAGHLLRGKFDNNRPELARILKTKASQFPEPGEKLISDAVFYYKDRTIGRRLLNLIFELRNYKKIYGREKH